MAGIIGQITAQARVRRLKKKISADKCNYILPPFSSRGFQPGLHNNYVRNQIRNTKARRGGSRLRIFSYLFIFRLEKSRKRTKYYKKSWITMRRREAVFFFDQEANIFFF